MNYQTTFTLSPNPAAVGTWSFDSSFFPHPVGLASFLETDSINSAVVSEMLNTQLIGTTHAAKYGSFQAMFRRWRLAYYSVTAYQDGPDLANQGTLVACQKPFNPYQYSGAYSQTSAHVGRVGLPVCYMQAIDMPQFNNSQSMPSAYFNNSKYGCYAPMKLSKLAHIWRSPTDAVSWAGSVGYLNPGTSYQQTLTGAALPTTGTGGAFPFTTLCPCITYNGAFEGSAWGAFADPTSPMCNDFSIDISAKNVAVATSFSFFVRCGYECECMPGTNLTSLQHISPDMDEQAIRSYVHISRLLKDGYPADYNDLAKIWKVICAAFDTASPYLSMIPVAGPMLGAVARAPKALTEAYEAFSAGRKDDRGAPSPAAKAVVQEAIARANTKKRSARPLPQRPTEQGARIRSKVLKKYGL
jgi:hypothetical protein